eukprot:3239807-Amphidinium_carterae.1
MFDCKFTDRKGTLFVWGVFLGVLRQIKPGARAPCLSTYSVTMQWLGRRRLMRHASMAHVPRDISFTTLYHQG